MPSAVAGVARRLDGASLRILDATIITIAWTVAFVAGFEGSLEHRTPGGALVYVGIPLVTQLVVNQVAGLYGPVWRYASVEEAVRVLAAVAIGAVVGAIEIAVLAFVSDATLPVFTAPAIAALLMLLGCGGVRFQARLFALERLEERLDADQRAERVRTVVVGADAAGITLARELSEDGDAEVVGFVDDDATLRGRSIRGLPVLGVPTDLADICRTHGVERVLIARPNASREERQALVDLALDTGAQVKVLPRTTDVLAGSLLRNLRDLDLTDLLGREHAPVDAAEIAGYLKGATVLITGAGGSIGSEIARQVAAFDPASLLLLDRDDSLLHEICDGELVGATPILANVRDKASMRAIFARYRPDVVFHAAALKHVPILEGHPVEAVRTNLLGAAGLALLAAESGCRQFVHISTDKAAQPRSVMGASKRAAELAVFEIGRMHERAFAAVRFGNVLGSRGSVVPTFLRQIVEGGPVTVTDPDMTRYFMTIPEAVSLVLQAGALAETGKVFLLDMGTPMSILDMAHKMIRIAGLRPGDDIEIEITGPRDGERLHEALHDDAEILEPSEHPSIAVVTPRAASDSETLFFFLDLLEEACGEANEPAVVNLLEQMLRHAGIECSLESARAACARKPAADAPAAGLNGTADRHTGAVRRPALLGGTPMFDPPLPFARPARPPLERVVRRLERSYERGQLTNGDLVRELEQRAADRLGVEHVVAVSSCTAGLMLALQSLVEGRRGDVLLPSFTFSATGHAVLWNNRRPRFADCDRETFQIALDADVLDRLGHDVVDLASEEVLDGVAAIMATHVFGAPGNPHEVERLARAHGLPVLFDAAHAFGAVARGRRVGTFGDAEVFSLSPTKVVVAGEGGLVATHDDELAERLRIGRDYGNPGDYDTRFAGLNARMSELHAALALESLEHLDETLERRRVLAERYATLLRGLPGVSVQRVPVYDVSTYKDFAIVVDPERFGLTRDQLSCVLAAEGVGSRNYFDPPVHRQRAYGHLPPTALPVTDAVSASVLCLPIYPDMRDGEVERVVDVVRTAHAHAEALESIAQLDSAASLTPTRRG